MRTTSISPEAVETELPKSVTDTNFLKALSEFYNNNAIPTDSFARAVVYAISQPEDVDISEILFRPTIQMF